MGPVLMPPNRFAHFYRGGAAITRLRGVAAPGPNSPEEWLASVTTRHGEDLSGLSRLPDGRLLRDAVAGDPLAWVGPRPPLGGPGDTGVLVKLLDPGQRLPVHAHPTREFASRHLGSAYGKTEAWYILDAPPRATVHLGFREDPDAAGLARAVDTQDAAWMLDRMHEIGVRPGDVVHVPAGTPHAIGEGIFLLEVQEPTDFSLLVEWQGFADPDAAFVGLDRATGLSAVDLGAWPAADVAAMHRHVALDERDAAPVALLPDAAGPFFRAHLVAPPRGSRVRVEPGFGVLVLVDGSGRIGWEGGDVAVGRGDVLAVPYATGPWALEGDATAVLCRPAA